MLYALKWVFELLTLACVTSFVYSAVEAVRANIAVDNYAANVGWGDVLVWVFADIGAIVGMVLFLLIWALIAHFGHQPFWG